MQARKRELQRLIELREHIVLQAVERLSEGRAQIACSILNQIERNRPQVQNLIENLIINKSGYIKFEVRKLISEHKRNIEAFCNAIRSGSISAARTLSRWIIKADEEIEKLLLK